MAEQILIPGIANDYTAAEVLAAEDVAAMVTQLNTYEIAPTGYETWLRLLKTAAGV